MFLKIMSGEPEADSDSRKAFKLFDNVESAQFSRDGTGSHVEVLFSDGDTEIFPCDGNVYLMNSGGETVAKYGPRFPKAA